MLSRTLSFLPFGLYPISRLITFTHKLCPWTRFKDYCLFRERNANSPIPLLIYFIIAALFLPDISNQLSEWCWKQCTRWLYGQSDIYLLLRRLFDFV